MTGLLELAERCEAATGPDRELDARILYALRPAMARLGTVDDYLRTDACKRVPAYTTSLDAAMTLVLEGWRLKMLDASVAGRFSWSLTGPKINIEDPESPGLYVWIPGGAYGCSGNITLALCAAALRARVTPSESSPT